MVKPHTRIQQIGGKSPAAAVDVDGDVLAVVVGLNLGTNVALVDFVAEAGDFVGGSCESHCGVFACVADGCCQSIVFNNRRHPKPDARAIVEVGNLSTHSNLRHQRRLVCGSQGPMQRPRDPELLDAIRKYLRVRVRRQGHQQTAERHGVSRYTLWRFLWTEHVSQRPIAVVTAGNDDLSWPRFDRRNWPLTFKQGAGSR